MGWADPFLRAALELTLHTALDLTLPLKNGRQDRATPICRPAQAVSYPQRSRRRGRCSLLPLPPRWTLLPPSAASSGKASKAKITSSYEPPPPIRMRSRLCALNFDLIRDMKAKFHNRPIPAGEITKWFKSNPQQLDGTGYRDQHRPDLDRPHHPQKCRWI